MANDKEELLSVPEQQDQAERKYDVYGDEEEEENGLLEAGKAQRKYDDEEDDAECWRTGYSRGEVKRWIKIIALLAFVFMLGHFWGSHSQRGNHHTRSREDGSPVVADQQQNEIFEEYDQDVIDDENNNNNNNNDDGDQTWDQQPATEQAETEEYDAEEESGDSDLEALDEIEEEVIMEGNVDDYNPDEQEEGNDDNEVINTIDTPYVVNLGLPKSGTSSFHKVLKSFEYPSYHYLCTGQNLYGRWVTNVKKRFEHSRCTNGNSKRGTCAALIFAAVEGGKKPLAGVIGRAFAQMDCVDLQSMLFPQIEYVELMMEKYQPHEIVFTLTTRSNEGWLGSVSRWGTMKKRFYNNLNGQTRWGHSFADVMWRDKEGVDNLIKDFKRWHEDRVRHLARTKGFHLIEFNLEDEEGLAKNFTRLANEFLHYNTTNVDYKWANQNSHKKKRGLLDDQDEERVEST